MANTAEAATAARSRACLWRAFPQRPGGDRGCRALFMLRLSTRAGSAGCLVIAALVIGVLVVRAGANAPARVEPPRIPVRIGSEAPSLLAAQARLDVLRNQAGSGNDLANRELSITLLDRYDLTADPDDLYEALIWVDRQLMMSGSSELVARVQKQYCSHPVVRWHWICNTGE